MASKAIKAVALPELPGYSIRRLQQIAVAIFLQEAEGSGLTPVQYAALHTVAEQPGIDQRSLAAAVALDTSTLASVVDRLEARGLLRRSLSPADKRVRLLAPTAQGRALLARARPAMQRAQQRILAPLPKAEQATFMRLLNALVSANNEHSRAPRAG